MQDNLDLFISFPPTNGRQYHRIQLLSHGPYVQIPGGLKYHPNTHPNA